MKTLLRRLLSLPMGLVYVALVVYSRRRRWLPRLTRQATAVALPALK